MKSKSKKIEELKRLVEKLPKSQITVFTSFAKAGEKGLSVFQLRELKNLLRSMESEYFVTKKTIMERAFKNHKGTNIYEMVGSLGLVLGTGDPYAIAKKVYEFSRKNQALSFLGAILENSFISKEEFLEIAKMPSREVLLGRLVGMLTYPMRGLAVALSEIAKQKEVTV